MNHTIDMIIFKPFNSLLIYLKWNDKYNQTCGTNHTAVVIAILCIVYFLDQLLLKATLTMF